MESSPLAPRDLLSPLETVAGGRARVGAPARRKRAPRGAAEAMLEALEGRQLLATFVIPDLTTAALLNAVNQANTTPGADVVTWAPGLEGTTTLAGTQLSITDDLTLVGPGAMALTISGNNASRAFGVGPGVTASISGLTILGGREQSGGGISNAGTLTLQGVIVAGNFAQLSGGGISNAGALTIINSAVAMNTSAGNGGGIDHTGGSGSLNVIASTISDNIAGGSGGGIFNGDAPLTVWNSTIAANASAGEGAGIFIDGARIPTLVSTIVAGNTRGGAPYDIFGALGAGSTHNLIQDGAHAGGLVHGVSGNVVGLDPLLGALGNNGGPTCNRAPLAGSPAIGGGLNPSNGTTDQRGTGFARVRGAGIDIGAVEHVPLPTVGSLTPSAATVGRGQTVLLTAEGVAAADDAVAWVDFYLDANANGVADVGERIGAVGAGFTLGYAVPATMGTGTARFLAVAVNTAGGSSAPALAMVTVANATPTLGVLAASATTLAQGDALTLTAGAAGDTDGAVVSVAFYLDSDRNGTPDAGELLGTDSVPADGISLVLTPAQTAAIRAGQATFLAMATDNDGAASGVCVADATILFAVRGGAGAVPAGAADGSDAHRVVVLNPAGHLIVFEQGWTAADLQARTGAPVATGDGVIWVDPKDGLTYVAAPSGEGLLLFTRSVAGDWSARNLTAETDASASPTHALTQLTSTGGIVVIAGITRDDRIVAFQQTPAALAGGGAGPAFRYVDISADLASQGMQTPRLESLISYVPSWDSWHLAGIDGQGQIQSVWVNPATFTTWRTDNLSATTGAPAVRGQLAVTLTSWGGINLAGLDTGGNVLTTWWVPEFGGTWRVNNLTAERGADPLVGFKISGYSTPWGGLNYVGYRADGQVQVYWWSPAMGPGNWNTELLIRGGQGADRLPTGALTTFASAMGTLNVYGATPSGDVIRMWWTPNGPDAWVVDDLTIGATRI